MPFSFEESKNLVFKTVDYLQYADKLMVKTLAESNRQADATRRKLKDRETSLKAAYAKKLTDIESDFNKFSDEHNKYRDSVLSDFGAVAYKNPKINQMKSNPYMLTPKEEEDLCAKLGVKDLGERVSCVALKNYVKSLAQVYVNKKVRIFTKKHKEAFKHLVKCSDLVGENVSAIIADKRAECDKRRETVLKEKDEAATALEKENNAALQKLAEEVREDREFIVDEAMKNLDDILTPAAIADMRVIMERNEKCKSANTDGASDRLIYMGQVACMLESGSANHPVTDAYLGKNPQLISDGLFVLPWTLSLDNCDNYILQSSRNDTSALCEITNEFMFNLLRQLPPNGVEFNVVDPINRGLSVRRYLTLKEKMPALFSTGISTSQSDIKKRLESINEYINIVIQQKLADKFDNIFEYNNASKDTPLPIKVLTVFDFPKYFDSSMMESLQSIMRNGAKCGIITVICYNSQESASQTYGMSKSIIEQLMREATILTEVDGFLSYAANRPLFLLTEPMPKQNDINAFFAGYEEACKKNLTKGVGFESIVNGQTPMFSMKSADGISIPVGKGDGAKTASIDFGKIGSSHHALITGGTGSGKSTLLHTVILSTIYNYSPDEVQLYLLDFKSGTEFKVYEKLKTNHLRLLALDAMQEFGESILIEINNEMERRSKLFKQSGVSDVKSYVDSTGNKLPRLLIIMDEFQILYDTSSNAKVARNCAKLTDSIVKLGRSYGIHLIMSTQSLRVLSEKSALENSTVDQMRIRIGLKFNDAEARRMFGASADDALKKMKGAIGTAVYNTDFAENDNTVFRTAYCDSQMKDRCIEMVNGACPACDNIKIFEGSRVPEYPVDASVSDDSVSVLIGEPIRIAPSIKVAMTKKKNANIIVVGQDERLSAILNGTIAYGVSRSDNCVIDYFDGGAFIGEESDSYVSELAEKRHNIRTHSTNREAIEVIEKYSRELNDRRQGKSENVGDRVLLINRLQNINLFCSVLKGDRIKREDYIPATTAPDTSAQGEEPHSAADFKEMFKAQLAGLSSLRGGDGKEMNYANALREIIESGYSYGIFVAISVNEPSVAAECFGHANISSNLLARFSNRIVFALNENDCGRIIPDLGKTPSDENSAVFYDGKTATQFKAYKLPEIN